MKIQTALVFLGILGILSSASAQENRRHERARRAEHIFLLGACAGQELSHQGIILPSPGDDSLLDDTTVAALRAALKDCRTQIKLPSPAPTPTPAPTSNSVPTPAPTPTPGPVPAY